MRLPRVLASALLTATWLGGVLAVSAPASATPRYAARYRQNCNLCHHNPTGGGMRSLYASQYLVPTEMAVRRWESEALQRIQPKLSESVSIGVDIRTVYHHADRERPAPENNFFQMQGDVYVAFEADPKFSAYLDRGQSSTLELFGLAYVLPYNGYVKFGRFTPAFGWKLSDHGQFVRNELFFEPPLHTDVGVEVGLYPDRFALVGSVVNGQRGSAFDFDAVLGYVAQASYRFNLGKAGLAVGTSYWTSTESDGLRRAAGPFWSLQLGPLTWLGEVDWSDLEPRGSDVGAMGLVASHEVTWQFVRGVDLRATYDFNDPDLDRQTGLRQRLGGGVDALLTPFFGVQAMGFYYDNDPGLDVSDDSYTQAEVVLHAFF